MGEFVNLAQPTQSFAQKLIPLISLDKAESSPSLPSLRNLTASDFHSE